MAFFYSPSLHHWRLQVQRGAWRFTVSDQGLWEFEPNTTRRPSRSLSDWCQHIRFQISAFISGSGFRPSGSFPYRDWGGNMYRFFKIERCSSLIWAASRAWWKCLECLYFFKQLWVLWQLCFFGAVERAVYLLRRKEKGCILLQITCEHISMKVMLMASQHHNTSRLGSVCECDSCWRRFD